jgi:hypothetical protein
MSDKHTIQLTVLVDMFEMEGTPYDSADIARDILVEIISSHWDADADVLIDEAYTADA